MERTRATWTDERLDDLSQRVDDLSRRMDDGFARVDGRFNAFEARVDSRFNAIESRFDALQRLMVQLAVGGFLTTLATLLTVVLTRG